MSRIESYSPETFELLETLSSSLDLQVDIQLFKHTFFIYMIHEATAAQSQFFHLKTLEAVAAVYLTDGQIQILEDQVRKVIHNKFNMSEFLNQHTIKEYPIDASLDQTKKENLVKNVRAFQPKNNSNQIRVVTIPINKTQFDKISIENVDKELKILESAEFNEDRAEKNYQKRLEIKEKYKALYKNISQKNLSSERLIVMKLLKQEIIIKQFVEKTKEMSLIGVIKLDSREAETAEKIKKKEDHLINKLFISQHISHRLFLIQEQNNFQNNPEFVAGMFISDPQLQDAPMKIIINKEEEKKHAHERPSLKTNLFELRACRVPGKQINQYFPKIIQHKFIKQIQQITLEACTSIATVLQEVYNKQDYPETIEGAISTIKYIREEENLNRIENYQEENIYDSYDEAIQAEAHKGKTKEQIQKEEKEKLVKLKKLLKEATITYTYEEIFSRFNQFRNLNLKTVDKLKRFIPHKSHHKDHQHQEDFVVPRVIQGIDFIHQLSALISKYHEAYERSSLEMGNNREGIISTCYKTIKAITQLIASIRKGYLEDNDTSDGRVYIPEDIQIYFNFIHFLFESMKLLTYITTRQFAIASVLHQFFNTIQPKKSRIIKEIIKSNSKYIIPNQTSRYYNIILSILNASSSEAERQQENIGSTKLIIHFYKAKQISRHHLGECSKIIQALKSLLIIYEMRATIPAHRKDQMCDFAIEIQFGKLLQCLALPELAYHFYSKNHMENKVKACFRDMVRLIETEEGAQIGVYFTIADYFLSVSDFNQASNYYYKAYQSTNDDLIRRKAMAGVRNCHARNNPEAENLIRRMERFEKQGKFEEFVNEPVPKEVLAKIKNIKWNQDLGRAEYR